MSPSMRKYAAIIDLEHPEPRHHRRMARHERAAQFGAFAALSGYGELVGDIEDALTRGEITIDKVEDMVMGRFKDLAHTEEDEGEHE